VFSAVREVVAVAVNLYGFALVSRFIAEELEERYYEAVSRNRGCGVVGRDGF